MSYKPNELLLPLTATSAGVLGAAYTISQLSVGLKRLSTEKLSGADEGTELYNFTRAAGTIGDYAPFGLILLGLLERERVAPTKKLEAWAGLFVVFRLAHGLQLALPKKVPVSIRAISFYSTIALLAAGSVSLLVAARKK